MFDEVWLPDIRTFQEISNSGLDQSVVIFPAKWASPHVAPVSQTDWPVRPVATHVHPILPFLHHPGLVRDHIFITEGNEQRTICVSATIPPDMMRTTPW